MKKVTRELDIMRRRGTVGLRKPTQTVFENSKKWTEDRLNDKKTSLKQIGGPDTAVLDFYWNEYFPPMFERLTVGETPYNYKNTIKSTFDKAVAQDWNWTKTITQMKSFVNVDGKNFPRWMYTRIVRTETARFVIGGHLQGAAKMGFKKFRRMVVEDKMTDPDLCLPYNDWIYKASEAQNVIPAHPACRCDLTPEPD
jgi:hypothetical protein